MTAPASRSSFAKCTAGDTTETILSGYPWLEREDVLACLAVDFSALLAEAGARVAAAGGGALAAQATALATEQFSLLAAGAVRAEPVSRDPRPPPAAAPQLNRLCLALAAEGHLATPRHQAIDLDAFGVRLAGLLDGTRDPAALIRALQANVAQGEVRHLAGASVGVVEANVRRLLDLFHHHGVLAIWGRESVWRAGEAVPNLRAFAGWESSMGLVGSNSFAV